MIKDTIFTDKMWNKMVDFNMSLPVPLKKADLHKPFVYDRKFGVFYVPSGYHSMVMSLLLAWQHGFDSPVDVAHKLRLRLSGDTADHWLEHTHGAAFRSSVGKTIQIASFRNLTVMERRYFHGATCVFPYATDNFTEK